MPKTINLTDIKIRHWMVSVQDQCVTVSYEIIDDQSSVWEQGEAVFWATMPEPGVDPLTGEPGYLPDNWYQLPAQYVSVLTDLTQDARTALLHLIGG
jgi:hypothetical protein